MFTATRKLSAVAAFGLAFSPAAQNTANWFKHAASQPEIATRLNAIKLIVADIDGSLTNGTVECRQDGEGTRWFSTQDGFGTKRAVEAGIVVAFLSGKGALSGRYRAQMLGIPENLCILGVSDKRPAVAQLQLTHQLAGDHVVMYGDDLLDAEVKMANPEIFFVAPANAPFYIQHAADLVLPAGGGEHAFRLLVDLVLYLRGQHPAQKMIQTALEAS